MSCTPCKAKKAARAAQKAALAAQSDQTSLPFITCYCGLARILPRTPIVGETVTLDICPRCGARFEGIFLSDGTIYIP